MRQIYLRTPTCSENSHKSVRDWLRELTAEDRKAIGTDIKTVQYGWPLGIPLVRKMEPGLWEVCSNLPDGIARVLFTADSGVMVLLYGFIKKSLKPRRPI